MRRPCAPRLLSLSLLYIGHCLYLADALMKSFLPAHMGGFLNMRQASPLATALLFLALAGLTLRRLPRRLGLSLALCSALLLAYLIVAAYAFYPPGMDWFYYEERYAAHPVYGRLDFDPPSSVAYLLAMACCAWPLILLRRSAPRPERAAPSVGRASRVLIVLMWTGPLALHAWRAGKTLALAQAGSAGLWERMAEAWSLPAAVWNFLALHWSRFPELWQAAFRFVETVFTPASFIPYLIALHVGLKMWNRPPEPEETRKTALVVMLVSVFTCAPDLFIFLRPDLFMLWCLGG